MYDALTEEENIPVNFLAVVRPRRRVTAFTLHTGSTYVAPFDFSEYVYKVTQNGAFLSLGMGPNSLIASQYYFDEDAKLLYVRMSDNSNPSTKHVVATYEMYFATFDAHWYRNPLDESSKAVYFEPLIKASPTIKSVTGDFLFGSFPVQSTKLDLINAEHTLERHIFESSFNKAEVLLYHWLDALKVANLKQVMNGVGADIDYGQNGVTLTIFDHIDTLDSEWRNPTKSFFATSEFPNIDAQRIGRPIPYVYGRVDGFKPTNISFVQDAPGTSDNRQWVVVNEQAGLSEKTFTVASGSTTTRTKLTTTPKGLMVGDSVKIDGTTDYYVKVTAVNYGVGPYFEHAAIGAPATAGDTVRKGFVSIITIIQNGQAYEALYLRDYTINLAQAGGCSGFTFSTSLESNLGMPSTLSPFDTVFCRVYGRVNDVTIGGVAFGADDAEAGVLCNPAVILFDLLKTKLGFAESVLNLSKFQALYTATISEAVGICIPKSTSNDFPKFKELITQLLLSMLARLFIDDDLKWAVAQLAPLGTENKELPQEEILDDSVSYAFKYSDLVSDVLVEYNPQELSATTDFDAVETVAVSSDTAKYLHEESSSKTFRSLHFKRADALKLANRISFYLGERRGRLSIASKNRFFDTLLGDTIKVTRDNLPGSSYKYSVEESQKSLRRVQLVLNDQKGIEDNAGSW